ncbi:MAG TPA: tetratricopeptide repeat protein [Polyangiaceae bacterium]|nr:tetratricopeptide repeat protein [Polyangiaceae bacterium]
MDFAHYAQRPDAQLALLEGSVLIAQDEYPGFQLANAEAAIEELALPLESLQLSRMSARAQARALSEHLYVACGFRGDVETYHAPENSYLNRVLERRQGIPISLAVVYMEVARRLSVSARGVGFPGHFLVRLDTEHDSAIVDPFFGGEILDSARLEQLLGNMRPRLKLHQDMLEPASVRAIIARMLTNLRAIYSARADAGRLLVVLDHLSDLLPDAVDVVRDRGFLHARMGANAAAIADLQCYVDVLPHADDAEQIRAAIERMSGSSSTQN